MKSGWTRFMYMKKGYRTPSWFRTKKQIKDKQIRILTSKRKSSKSKTDRLQ